MNSMPKKLEDNPSGMARARSSIVWNAGFNVFRQGLQFAQAVVLARLILPDAYGQFAFVSSVLALLSVLSFQNVLAHVLQPRILDDSQYQHHFTAGLYIQGALFLLTNVVAFCFRLSTDLQSLSLVTHLVSIKFLLNWPSELRQRMLEREFDWKRRRILHGIGLLTSSAIAVIFAYLGLGVYALLLPVLVCNLPFIYDLFVYKGWRPNWDWNWHAYKPAFMFGISRTGSAIAVSGKQLLESSVLGFRLGFDGLGIVNRSVGLSQLFGGAIADQLLLALYPMLPQLDVSSGQVARVGGVILRVVVWVTLPLACGVSWFAAEAISIVYGPNWGDSASLLPWSMAMIFSRSVLNVSYHLTLAQHLPKLCFWIDATTLGATVLGLGIFEYCGIIGYFAIQSATHVVLVCGLIGTLLGKECLTFEGILSSFCPAFFSASSAMLIIFGASSILGVEKTPIGLAIVLGIIFLLAYLLILRLFFRKPLEEIVSMMPRRIAIEKCLWL